MIALEESTSPMAATLTNSTRYFEVDSQAVGARFGIWVCTPSRYHSEDTRYPAIYQPDGNGAAGTMARMQLLRDDPINPHVPFISVCVGYVGKDAQNSLAVRARDLLPPNEPISLPSESEFVEGMLQTGMLDEEGARAYHYNLSHPAADRFLTFLQEELHPLLAREYRIDDSSLGLFGHSYGGLFAAWVATQRSTFRRIGASSPGILPGASQVLAAYDAEYESGADHSGRVLHVGVAAKEITEPTSYASKVGAGTAELFTRLATTPLKGLRVSTHIVPEESHFTVNYAVLASYLRACYSAPEATGLI